MKLTVHQLIEINRSLIHLGNINDLFCAYDVVENLAKLTEIASKFDNDQKKIVDKYVLKNSDGTYKTKGENSELNDFGKNHDAFEKEFMKMIQKENEIEFVRFSKDDIKTTKGEKINPPAVVLLPLRNTVIK